MYKFLIRRASIWGFYEDRSKLNIPEPFNSRLTKEFYEKDKRNGWFLELNSLEELLDLIIKVEASVIVGKSELLIYDYYIE